MFCRTAPILLAIYTTGGRHLGRLVAILNPPTLNSSRHDTYRTHGSHYDTNQLSSHRALDLYNQWQPSQWAGSHLKPNQYSTADTLPRGTAAILLLTYRTDSSHCGNRLDPNRCSTATLLQGSHLAPYPRNQQRPYCLRSIQPMAAILIPITAQQQPPLRGSHLAPYPCNQQQPS